MPIGAPVGGMYVSAAQSENEENHRDLDNHDGGIEPRAFFDADRQNCCNDQRNYEGWQVESNLHAENPWGVYKIMGTLHQLRRMGRHQGTHFVQEHLRSRNERRV